MSIFRFQSMSFLVDFDFLYFYIFMTKCFRGRKYSLKLLREIWQNDERIKNYKYIDLLHLLIYIQFKMKVYIIFFIKKWIYQMCSHIYRNNLRSTNCIYFAMYLILFFEAWKYSLKLLEEILQNDERSGNCKYIDLLHLLIYTQYLK